MSEGRKACLIVLATRNRGKVVELRGLLVGLPVGLALLGDVASATDIAEPFSTFRENAAHKAVRAAHIGGEWALGEDSGLEVDALAGRPGVYSARFAGKGAPDEERIRLLLAMMSGVPEERRGARFRCSVALAGPQGLLGQWEGLSEGRITTQPRGDGGFGFDPVFIARGMDRTNAELSSEEKNRISHRGQAMRKLAQALPGILASAQA